LVTEASQRNRLIPLGSGFFVLSFLLFQPIVRSQPIPGVDISPFGCQSVWPVNGDLVTYLDRMQEAGIQWGRFDLCWWSLAETQRGVYDFVSPDVEGWEGWNTDRAIQLMKDRGIEPFPIICYGNGLYDEGKGPYSDAGRTGFANYCHAAASRYRDSVTYWEIWNEPNLEQFWARLPDPADYARLAAAAAPRIREANPDAVVVGGVTSGIDAGFLETAFQSGLLDAVDAITVHPYRIAPPESINPEIANLRNLIAQYTSRDVPIWTGEWGYNTYWTELTALGQAKCLQRMMVNNLSQGVCLSIWFSVHAFKEADPSGTDAEWGLLDYSLQPRSSFHAMRVLNERMPAPITHAPGALEVTVSPRPADLRVEVFSQGTGDHLVVALWQARWPLSDTFAGEMTTVTLPGASASSVSAWDGLTGNEIAVDFRTAGPDLEILGLRVKDYPVFLDVDLSANDSGLWFFY
jgi:hypothetical protein